MSDKGSRGKDPSGNSGDDSNELKLTASADGILDVTPVSSGDEGNDAITPLRPSSRSEVNVDAFSSSSEENSLIDRKSEWDKALKRGRQSKGQATDFFAAPNYSQDESDFLSHADLDALKEASTAGEDSDAGSSSPQHRATRSGPTLPSPEPVNSRALDSSQSFVSTSTTSHAATIPPSKGQTRTSFPSSTSSLPAMRPHPTDEHLETGVLPDVLMTMRQKIESLTLFDSDMMKYAGGTIDDDDDDDEEQRESRESLKRSSQQSISASVLVSLAHKRYERRRLAAMEIEKVVRSLVHQAEIERVRAILLLLSDDYVRSTNEDARKGGVVALAACAIGLKKASDTDAMVMECRDLILASVIHACQDHSQRVRYYATESLFNVVKVIPSLAVQHFFILYEILRSLYADVDVDVRSGAELLDKKLKEVLVNAINSGTYTAEACVPVFARFVHLRNKATNRLTLTWLQELNEKLVGSPILEFLHLFLGGIYNMVADPTVAIRQSALAFLQSVLPKLLVVNAGARAEELAIKVDFDKILQSLVTTMEHPDPFVRKVAMYWMSRIVKAHMSPPEKDDRAVSSDTDGKETKKEEAKEAASPSPASVSVRNSLPHVLPGIFLSIGDGLQPSNIPKEVFLPDQSTRDLAEQTNSCLQDAVRRDGASYIQHLDGFIVALREELDSPGGLSARNPPAIERTPYRMDVNQDGTGIEAPGWFRASVDQKGRSDDSMIMSRLCALHWVIVLYESVVPDLLKADYAREFVFAIIHQLVDDPPKDIVFKSLEVLAKITVPVYGEDGRSVSSTSLPAMSNPSWASFGNPNNSESAEIPMTDSHVSYALDILKVKRRKLMSRNREVFSALIQLHARNEDLLSDLSSVITYMCKLQPPEFVFVSFSVELDRFIRMRRATIVSGENGHENEAKEVVDESITGDLKFISSFVQHMAHVLLNSTEAKPIRDILKDCVGSKCGSERDRQRARLFHILLHSFSHNLAASLALCLWAGAYRTATIFLGQIDPLDIDLMFLLDVDRLIELLERPLFRHLHIRMLEPDLDRKEEGSGAMLFQTLKALLMILPQSACYWVLKDRLTSASRFRQSAIAVLPVLRGKRTKIAAAAVTDAELYVKRVCQVREVHCAARWRTIRGESLEQPQRSKETSFDIGADRREWLGYASKADEENAKQRYGSEKKGRFTIEEIKNGYHDLDGRKSPNVNTDSLNEQSDGDPPKVANNATADGGEEWTAYWES